MSSFFKYLAMVFLSLAAGASPLAAANSADQWKEIRRSGEVAVYEKKGSGNAWVATRAETVIHAPLDSVLSFFTDMEKSRRITPHCKEKRILRSFSQSDRIVYSRIKIIWPFRDRYLIYRDRQTRPAPDQVLLTMESSDAVALADPQRILGKVRKGRFWFASVDQGRRTRVILESELHAGGWLPAWMLRFAARHWMVDMFRNLNKALGRLPEPPSKASADGGPPPPPS